MFRAEVELGLDGGDTDICGKRMKYVITRRVIQVAIKDPQMQIVTLQSKRSTRGLRNNLAGNEYRYWNLPVLFQSPESSMKNYPGHPLNLVHYDRRLLHSHHFLDLSDGMMEKKTEERAKHAPLSMDGSGSPEETPPSWVPEGFLALDKILWPRTSSLHALHVRRPKTA